MNGYHILTGRQIDRSMIAEAIQLDRISYDDVYQLQVETCFDYFERNPDIYLMAVNDQDGSIIGYVNFSPVRESVFLQMLSGTVIDTVIAGSDVLPYRGGGLYYGYFSSIVVHPAFRRNGVAAQMLLAWSDLVLRLAAERDVYFREIVADAVSDVGAHLLSELGFTFVRPSLHASRIMTLDFFSELTEPSRFNEKVLAVYRENREKKVD